MNRRNRKSLANRYDDTYQHNEGSKRGAFNFPSGTKFYKVNEDGVRHTIIIVPYEIKSKNHPLIATRPKDFQIGDPDYLMDVWVHQFVGPEKCDIICLLKNYGRPCPLCEEADKYRKAGKKEEASSLSASRRSYYNIIDAKHPEEGIQVFHHSHNLFQKGLIKEAQSEAKDGSFVDFAGCENGKIISFRADEEKRFKMKFYECNSIRFRDYKEYEIQWKDEWLDQAISFDEVMEVLTPDEICERVFLEPAKAVDVQEKGSVTAIECPHGHIFGVDIDKHNVCDDCKVWKECDAKEKENRDR